VFPSMALFRATASASCTPVITASHYPGPSSVIGIAGRRIGIQVVGSIRAAVPRGATVAAVEAIIWTRVWVISSGRPSPILTANGLSRKPSLTRIKSKHHALVSCKSDWGVCACINRERTGFRVVIDTRSLYGVNAHGSVVHARIVNGLRTLWE
jgi:hypothetical protein